MLILVSDPFNDSLPKALSAHAEVTDDPARLGEAEVLLVRSRTQVTSEYLDGAPNLKLVIRGGVGLDNIDLDSAAARGIEVMNTADASTIAVVELAMALLLALPNHLTRADQSTRDGQWLKKELQRSELWGKTLGIVGLGRIGIGIAVRAQAFGMRVIARHPRRQFSEFAELQPSLTALLEQSDYITLNVPLTDETKGLINAGTLTQVKEGAFLVNTGRGACVVEADVADALRSGRLRGFATDVFETEPPTGSPLLEAPNCILIPHLGASSVENMNRISTIIERTIAEYCARR